MGAVKNVFQTRQFKKDLKRVGKRGKDIQKLKVAIVALAQGHRLGLQYRDHPLSGEWMDSRDCHIEPDWLLIYRLANDCLTLERTGSHSDLFKS